MTIFFSGRVISGRSRQNCELFIGKGFIVRTKLVAMLKMKVRDNATILLVFLSARFFKLLSFRQQVGDIFADIRKLRRRRAIQVKGRTRWCLLYSSVRHRRQQRRQEETQI